MLMAFRSAGIKQKRNESPYAKRADNEVVYYTGKRVLETGVGHQLKLTESGVEIEEHIFEGYLFS